MWPRLIIAYTDGSSESEYNSGGSSVFLKYPENTTSKHKFTVGKISSNFTCEFTAISTALDIYLTLTNITNSDGVILFSDCRSALEAIKKGKMISPKKSILVYSPLVYWANHATPVDPGPC
ncbi:RNase H domain-containing protein [Trichonephila clavipes]|nr:RNase H domain-containing protein [Trichonephila clavipes]